MNDSVERAYDVEHDPLDITGRELANLLDAGLSSTEIDRLRFTRWRLRTHQLEGDGWPQSGGSVSTQAMRPLRWAGHRGSI
jgi:hypothetical protein